VARKRSSGGKAKRRSSAKAKESNRPKTIHQWSDQSMVGAMEAVQEGRMGVNRAALQFGVPRTTLKDRIAGRVIHGSKSGPKPYLTYKEEKEVVDFLVTCNKTDMERQEVKPRNSRQRKPKGPKKKLRSEERWLRRKRRRVLEGLELLRSQQSSIR